jgi:pimeloyl-ACP methyl ester carboxylesterase
MATVSVTQAYVQVPEGRIHYVKHGTGFPIIMTHSMGQSWWGFEDVLGPLGENHTCYAMDMLGHGDSDKPLKDFSWLDMARSVVHFMEALNIQKAHLMGVSVGAALAVEVASSHPELVDRVVLVGCPVWGPAHAAEMIKLPGMMWDENGMYVTKTREQLIEGASFADPSPQVVAKFNELWSHAGRSTYDIFVALAWYDIISRLKHIKAPTMILYGEKDFLRDGEEILRHNIPNSRKVVMAGLGHHPPTEDPDGFLKEALPFLKGK